MHVALKPNSAVILPVAIINLHYLQRQTVAGGVSDGSVTLALGWVRCQNKRTMRYRTERRSVAEGVRVGRVITGWLKWVRGNNRGRLLGHGCNKG